MPYFDEDKDFMDSYLNRFEQFATSQKWDQSTWALCLSALLWGRALDVYSMMSKDDVNDYEKLSGLTQSSCGGRAGSEATSTGLTGPVETAGHVGTTGCITITNRHGRRRRRPGGWPAGPTGPAQLLCIHQWAIKLALHESRRPTCGCRLSWTEKREMVNGI